MSKEFMKIMSSDIIQAVPMEFIRPHEAQAKANHGQSLDRLNERGGVCPSEAVGIVLGTPWGRLMKNKELAELQLLRELYNWGLKKFVADQEAKKLQPADGQETK